MAGLTHRLAALGALALGLVAPAAARAQCMLANPSFELVGSGGAVFAGWQQFGAFGSSTDAVHGARGARVSGSGQAWGVSGYWQQLDAVPGVAWAASVRVSHSTTRPLTGQSQAIVNIEWRNASGALISYESHVAADASTPAGEFRTYAFQSGPAPAGTAAARIVVGVLHGPGNPVPDVIYDLVAFHHLGSPTLDQVQWGDFAGGRTLTFSGRTWRVKGPGYYGPGPNLFSNSASSVWVDASDRLHLTIRNVSGSWYSTEVALEDVLGYGDYIFTTRGRLDTLDPRTVLGMFVWQYGQCYDPAYLWWNPYNEFDIEFSRWGVPGNPVGQYVAQPYDYPGNLSRFGATFSTDEVTSHAFRWLPGRVEARSWRGGPADEATSVPIHAWTYAGPHLPRPEQPRVHLNLWQFEGPPATNQEVVLDAFTFVPGCAEPPCDVLAAPPASGGSARLDAARPNPFVERTSLRFTVAAEGPVDLAVYDLAGRRVRTLVRGVVAAGPHDAAWDGRDEAGRRLAAGVYFCRLRSNEGVETRRAVLVQ
jgi:hypothetical protein